MHNTIGGLLQGASKHCADAADGSSVAGHLRPRQLRCSEARPMPLVLPAAGTVKTDFLQHVQVGAEDVLAVMCCHLVCKVD